MVTTLALYGGGLLAVYPAGRLVHHFGTRPVLLSTCWLRGLAVGGLGLTPLLSTHGEVLGAVAALFLIYALLSAAFGVAEIQVLFCHAPAEAPSAVIVAPL